MPGESGDEFRYEYLYSFYHNTDVWSVLHTFRWTIFNNANANTKQGQSDACAVSLEL